MVAPRGWLILRMWFQSSKIGKEYLASHRSCIISIASVLKIIATKFAKAKMLRILFIILTSL